MPSYPECLEILIGELARFPGIGRKSAERLAFHVLTRPAEEIRTLSSALTNAREQIGKCETCFGISEEAVCQICADPSRKENVLCVVGQARDVFALERGAIYRGRYHVLEGVISPLSGIGPDELTIDALIERLKGGAIDEVVLALNPSTEGETTSMYLADIIRPLNIKVTRIAYGLPVGGELEFSDPVTLARALEGRRDL